MSNPSTVTEGAYLSGQGIRQTLRNAHAIVLVDGHISRHDMKEIQQAAYTIIQTFSAFRPLSQFQFDILLFYNRTLTLPAHVRTLKFQMVKAIDGLDFGPLTLYNWRLAQSFAAMMNAHLTPTERLNIIGEQEYAAPTSFLLNGRHEYWGT